VVREATNPLDLNGGGYGPIRRFVRGKQARPDRGELPCNGSPPHRDSHWRRHARRACAKFDSNGDAPAYRPRNAAHFDDHQLHDDLQLAGGQLPDRLCSSGNFVDDFGRNTECHGQHIVFVELRLHPPCLSDSVCAGFPVAVAMTSRLRQPAARRAV
jgi:hypothetical protein